MTGSGKTYTIANLIAGVNRPTLVLSPNKTLAAQLFSEFKAFFPENAVEYFVSYYDYYQPEAYIPQSDTYIEKDALINDEIDRMRHSATRSLLERRDVIVVASVSCIYGIGAPETYQGMHLAVREGDDVDRDAIIRRLVARAVRAQRLRLPPRDVPRARRRGRGVPGQRGVARRSASSCSATPSTPSHRIDPLQGRVLDRLDRDPHLPGQPLRDAGRAAGARARDDAGGAGERLSFLRGRNRLLEAQRLEQRTLFDMEMLRELGYCHGIENYSRHLTGRRPGEAPPALIDYLPKDALVIIDESHVAVPQVRGMYYGDRSRKEALVEYGFRLPSAFDNRPLTFEEFTRITGQTVYVSATPRRLRAGARRRRGGRAGDPSHRAHGSRRSRSGRPAIRWTTCSTRSGPRAEREERVLVTTLTKRMAEDLTEYYQQAGMRVRYLHSDIDTLDRMAIIRDLRLGKFDALVGINLLREGLDIPEVSLVAILDADKEGYLRSRPRSSRRRDAPRATSTARSSCTPTR